MKVMKILLSRRLCYFFLLFSQWQENGYCVDCLSSQFVWHQFQPTGNMSHKWITWQKMHKLFPLAAICKHRYFFSMWENMKAFSKVRYHCENVIGPGIPEWMIQCMSSLVVVSFSLQWNLCIVFKTTLCFAVICTLVLAGLGPDSTWMR